MTPPKFIPRPFKNPPAARPKPSSANGCASAKSATTLFSPAKSPDPAFRGFAAAVACKKNTSPKPWKAVCAACKTDYLDLYQTHWPDRNTNFFGRANYRHSDTEKATPLEETLAALGELQAAGKIRAFGVSNETPWGMSRHLRLAEDGLPRMQSVQNPYNLLNRSYEIGMAEISARENCGLLPYSPLAFGALSGKYLGGKKPAGARLTRWGDYFKRYTTDKAVQATADYAALAKKRGVSLAAMAVAFSIHQPFVTSSIIGATTLEQLRENIAAAELHFDDDWRAELDALGDAHFNPCP